MMAIVKNDEPRSSREHRTNAHATYDNHPSKDELRLSLVAEQRGLCCYCMSRIKSDFDSMKIEHWQCQHEYVHRELDYTNLLGACKGGEGNPPHKQHCDTRKGSADLKWNPADPTHAIDSRINYSPDGSIGSNDEVFDQQLENILNLNIALLKNNRKGVLDAIVIWWKSEKARRKGPVPKAIFERQIEMFLARSTRQPFCGVAVWWLRQRIGRMT